MENLGHTSKMKKILLTGADGYIGATLGPMLTKQGYQVTGLDNFYFEDQTLGNHQPSYKIIKKDVRQIENSDLDGFDVVIHLAALSNDPLGKINPELTQDINFQASLNLAKKAKKQGVKKFIFSSSCSIYGIGEEEVVNENSPINPLTAYAKSKIKTETELIKLSDDSFCVGLLRNSTVYGYSPKFRNDLVVNNLTTTGYFTGEIQIKSDGTPWRPLIDVRDLSQIFIEFVKADPKLINAEIFNIGFNQNNFQVKDVGDAVQTVLPNCKIVYTGEHGSDSRSYKVNFDKLHTAFPHLHLNWPLTKSIQDLVDHIKNSSYSLQDFQNNKFVRLDSFQKLIKEHKLNQNLEWS